jgi:hypothetical protein
MGWSEDKVFIYKKLKDGILTTLLELLNYPSEKLNPIVVCSSPTCPRWKK